VSVAVLIGGSTAWAAQAKSDAVGGDATCRVLDVHTPGSWVSCTLRDTKADGNYVRLEWSGPGQSGKEDLRLGSGSTQMYMYDFKEGGDFRFKAVVDKGVLPDDVGATKTLKLRE
jgi:hypothetical protein